MRHVKLFEKFNLDRNNQVMEKSYKSGYSSGFLDALMIDNRDTTYEELEELGVSEIDDPKYIDYRADESWINDTQKRTDLQQLKVPFTKKEKEWNEFVKK